MTHKIAHIQFCKQTQECVMLLNLVGFWCLIRFLFVFGFGLVFFVWFFCCWVFFLFYIAGMEKAVGVLGTNCELCTCACIAGVLVCINLGTM